MEKCLLPSNIQKKICMPQTRFESCTLDTVSVESDGLICLVMLHTKNVTSFFLSKPCHIDKLRLVKYADEFLTTLQSGLSKTSQKVVKYVSHNALLNSERGSNGGQRS